MTHVVVWFASSEILVELIVRPPYELLILIAININSYYY